MIINGEQDVTKAVLSEIDRAPDPRFREVMSAFIRHLHDFAREVKLTEEEFQTAIGYIVALGKHTNENHNEAVLMAGSLGFSALICLLNNGDRGQTETDASQLGPFWRMNSPRMANGASIVRSPTPGPTLFVEASFRDAEGKPIEGAEVDVWHSSPEGFYENQDPIQSDMNLRGKFITDVGGRISFRSVKPAGYPIPIDGSVGELLRAPAFPRLQAGLQDADLAGLRARRQAHRQRRAVRRHPPPHRQLRAPRRAERGNRRCHPALVHARPRLGHGKRRRAPAESADQRQSPGRAAANSAFGAGVKKLPARPALLPADLDSHIVDQPRLADLCGDQQADRPVLVGVDWRESLGVARLEVVEDEARALDDAATFP